MALSGSSIVSIDDISKGDLDELFELADRICARPGFGTRLASGVVAATLFYEPSTRTRLSFESAMLRLGGGNISVADVRSSSVTKGETLADTVRVVSGYADLIVLRHPDDGAARLAAEYATVPVINAGDGGHEHPTQTLCDLYTLRAQHGHIQGLTVALCGDLSHGRTIHSLIFALARLGANMVFVPGDGKDVPDHVVRRLRRDFGAVVQKREMGELRVLFGEAVSAEEKVFVDAIYMTPTEQNQLALLPEVRIAMDAKSGMAIYVTRLQKERDHQTSDDGLMVRRYPRVSKALLAHSNFKDVSILHPLPRVNEISTDMDDDPRGLYFKQSAYGVPIRMALLCKMLNLEDSQDLHRGWQPLRSAIPIRPSMFLVASPDFACTNDNCITRHEAPRNRAYYELIRDDVAVARLRCAFCDVESDFAVAGNTASRTYFGQRQLHRMRKPVAPQHLRFFKTEQDALDAGFRAPRRPVSAAQRHGESRRLEAVQT